MSWSCTLSQLFTATPISFFVQCQISFQLLLLLEVQSLPMVSKFHSVICTAYLLLMKAYRWNQRAMCHSTDTILGTSVIIRLIIYLFYLRKWQTLLFFSNFISGSKCSFSRNVISYKSDFNTAVALFWKLEPSLQKTTATQAILKKWQFSLGTHASFR